MRTTLCTTDSAAETYLQEVRTHLADLLPAERDRLLSLGRAHLELELELQPAVDGQDRSAEALARLGKPESFARRLRADSMKVAAPNESAEGVGLLASCRSCRREVSREAVACPHCGAPWPARAKGGTGYEWKSQQTLWGYPLVHVAYGRDEQGRRRVAKGVIAIGQYAVGAVTIAQFGVGAVFGLGQFVAAPIAIGQFALGLVAVGQIAIAALYGVGMIATGLKTIGLWTLDKALHSR